MDPAEGDTLNERGESAGETANIVRSLLDHESDVINHRMSWFGSFQGFLFAALGLAWNKQAKGLIIVFCILGLATSTLCLIGLIGASFATRRLVLWWRKHAPLNYDGPPVIGHEIQGDSRLRYMFPPWTVTALCFILAWIAILLIGIRL